MTRAQAENVANYILSHFDERSVGRLVEALEEAVVALGYAYDRVDILAFAERSIESTKAALAVAIEERSAANSFVPLTLHQSFLVGTRFVGRSYVAANWQLSELQDALADLSEWEFEQLGWSLLHQLGVENIFQTPRTRDGGVDFFGSIPIGVRGTRPVNILVAAEFKSSQVSTAELRAFREGANRQRFFYGRESSRSRIPSEITVYRCTPIIYIIFCGTQLSNDARIEAGEDGVIVFENAQISNLLEALLSRSAPIMKQLLTLSHSVS